MTGATSSAAPRWAEADLARIADAAARMWAIYTGGWVESAVAVDTAHARLIVRRAASPPASAYPSLIDASLVWLILESASPGAPIAELGWQRDRALRAMVSPQIPSPAAPQIERYARTIAFEATRPAVPLCGHVDPGRGAWEQAGFSAESALCRDCRFRRGSNLDCPTCRDVVIQRKTSARWDRQRVVRGLQALDFDEQVAAEAALQAELVLRQIRRPLLSHEFFEIWARRFAEATKEVFSGEDDRLIARDLVEAQMVQPWFGPPPPAEKVRPLPPPPTPTDEDIHAQGRRLVRALILSGLARSQAERRVQAVLLLRRLLAAEGELVERELAGITAGVVGDLEHCALEVRDGEHVLIRVSASPLGRAVELSIELDDDERTRLAEALGRAHRRLMAQIERGRRGDDEEDDDRLFRAGLERLLGALREVGDGEAT